MSVDNRLPMEIQSGMTLTNAIAGVTDVQLVEQVRAGNINAFEIIMRRYNQRLYRIARSILRAEHEAMDVVQETYVKAYYQLDTFVGPDGFASWLSRIVSNEALMRVRKSKYIDYILDDPEGGDIDMESINLQPMDELANKQLSQWLEKAIDQLSIHYRSVYVMRAIQQLSTRETAESLGISEDLVKTRYLRAKKNLQALLETYLESTNLELFEFAGHRCDLIVKTVLSRVSQSRS